MSGASPMREMPEAIVLCGGAGTRLKTVTGDAPKAMAPIAGRPFLEVLLRQLRRNGFQRVILAVGYRADAIRAHFGDAACGMQISYSYEESPLGTGGALRKAAELATSHDVFVMNGDSYADVDFDGFVADHRANGADTTVLVLPVDGRTDCGIVEFDRGGRYVGFLEKKEGSRAGYLNAGIYVVSRHSAGGIPADRDVSLERDVFPRWLEEGRNIRVFVRPGQCIDIGTPERYREAQELLAGVEAEAVALAQEGQR